MNYTELSIQLKESPVLRELLVFKLAEFGFESFQDLDGELKAFVSAKEFKMESVHLVKSICKADLIKVAIIEHKAQNWNQQWETNFSPIMVNDNCVIRTSFHDIKAVKYDVIIDPAMTFGTGHHETTLMMAQSLFDQPISGADVLDMGTGTGALEILCNLLKAKNVVAIDNDPIAVENTLANYSLNKIAPANVFLGDSALINENQFDYILANINKNILLNDLNRYYLGLKPGGKLIISGFFSLDNDELIDCAKKIGLNFVSSNELNQWSILTLVK